MVSSNSWSTSSLQNTWPNSSAVIGFIVPVPNILEALNINDMYGNNETARGRYRVAVMGRSSASDCLKCGRCEEACPQHIEIRSHLERAVNELA